MNYGTHCSPITTEVQCTLHFQNPSIVWCLRHQPSRREWTLVSVCVSAVWLLAHHDVQARTHPCQQKKATCYSWARGNVEVFFLPVVLASNRANKEHANYFKFWSHNVTHCASPNLYRARIRIRPLQRTDKYCIAFPCVVLKGRTLRGQHLQREQGRVAWGENNGMVDRS